MPGLADLVDYFAFVAPMIRFSLFTIALAVFASSLAARAEGAMIVEIATIAPDLARSVEMDEFEKLPQAQTETDVPASLPAPTHAGLDLTALPSSLWQINPVARQGAVCEQVPTGVNQPLLDGPIKPPKKFA
jgi:hypothetical protein